MAWALGNARTGRVADERLCLPQVVSLWRIPKLELVGDELSPSWGGNEDVGRCRGRIVIAVASARERDALRLLCAGGNEKNKQERLSSGREQALR